MKTLSHSPFLAFGPFTKSRHRLQDERVLYYDAQVWCTAKLDGSIKVDGSIIAQLKVLNLRAVRRFGLESLSGTAVVTSFDQAVSLLLVRQNLGSLVKEQRTGMVVLDCGGSRRGSAEVAEAAVFVAMLLCEQVKLSGFGSR